MPIRNEIRVEITRERPGKRGEGGWKEERKKRKQAWRCKKSWREKLSVREAAAEEEAERREQEGEEEGRRRGSSTKISRLCSLSDKNASDPVAPRGHVWVIHLNLCWVSTGAFKYPRPSVLHGLPANSLQRLSATCPIKTSLSFYPPPSLFLALVLILSRCIKSLL